ncbi:Gfo/Idh/MocA family protein [Gordonia rhizosphera]|uniref:Putative oxidoreductase n=1 Tax=Gordonia rhizosphera NBRC 16068 TaxID=1108045 RepID=K6X2B2_9ACTN|nr:Gfo/Idh/MocA family oxidoreductase [Gordonia rhizosphera]GAB92929.1 putative oxidoreductase [Gordonia rhizosphera NBRC 16068]
MSATARPLRIGLLGASRIAESAIVGPAQTLGHRLVAVAARDRGRAEAFAGKYGVERVLDSYDDVINDPEVDVVYNPLANSLHGPWNLAAIRAGKPVLSEKPFARNTIEAREVADAARAAGVTVLEGFHYLFHPLMHRTVELLDAGAIGAVQEVEVVMAMPSPDDGDPRWSYEMAGGALMDLGCYSVHVSRLLGRWCGGTPEITGGRAVLRSPQIDESAVLDMRFPNGARGTQAVSMAAGEFVFSLRIVGDRGSLYLHDYLGPNRDDRLTFVSSSTGAVTVEHLGTRSTYTYQLEAFADTVHNGASLPIDLEDAVDNMRHLDDAYRAIGLEPR